MRGIRERNILKCKRLKTLRIAGQKNPKPEQSTSHRYNFQKKRLNIILTFKCRSCRWPPCL